MHNIAIALALVATLLLSGCTRHETKENLDNVKGGLKNTWKNVKKEVSETTKEFEEETR